MMHARTKPWKYTCGYVIFMVIFSVNINEFHGSYCVSDITQENCPTKELQTKTFSNTKNVSVIQLRPIVAKSDGDNWDIYYDNLDIEKDKREKFFFVETSQRDHLRKYIRNKEVKIDL